MVDRDRCSVKDDGGGDQRPGHPERDLGIRTGIDHGQLPSGGGTDLGYLGADVIGPYPRIVDTGCDYAAGCSVAAWPVS